MSVYVCVCSRVSLLLCSSPDRLCLSVARSLSLSCSITWAVASGSRVEAGVRRGRAVASLVQRDAGAVNVWPSSSMHFRSRKGTRTLATRRDAVRDKMNEYTRKCLSGALCVGASERQRDTTIFAFSSLFPRSSQAKPHTCTCRKHLRSRRKAQIVRQLSL